MAISVSVPSVDFSNFSILFEIVVELEIGLRPICQLFALPGHILVVDIVYYL